MHTQTKAAESEQIARLEWAILGLLVTPHNPRPWSEAELDRAINLPGDVRDGVERLRRIGLVHRFGQFVSATCAAIRCDEIAQEQGYDENPGLAADRRMEGDILHVLRQTRDVMPMSERDIRRALRIKKKDKLAVADALNRLAGVGLVDRPGGLVIVSDAAVRYAAIEL